LAEIQWLAAVQDKPPALLNGDFKPTTNEERLGLIELCMLKKLYHTSAGLYSDAIGAHPNLANDLQAFHRYNADTQGEYLHGIRRRLKTGALPTSAAAKRSIL
jgi:hypothetical protein